MTKTTDKEKAIALRRKGLSYTEILAVIPVAKSTLSLWLHSVGLSKRQTQRLTDKKLAAMRRGWEQVHKARLERIREATISAQEDVANLIQDPLWLAGTALYWAEGSKMKSWRRGEKVTLSNTDATMIALMQKWVLKYVEKDPTQIVYEIYIHRSAESRLANIKKYWSGIVGIPNHAFRVYFKNNIINTKRRNTGEDYKGLLRIRIKKSARLNHKISGWIEGLRNQL